MFRNRPCNMRPWAKTKAKFKNVKTRVDNITFDSNKEARVYQDLKLLLQAGEVQKLELQRRFTLVPAQYEEKKCVEKSVVYVADFVVTKRDGTVEVIDCKGAKTKDYIIKRKMMRWVLGIRIKEL